MASDLKNWFIFWHIWSTVLISYLHIVFETEQIPNYKQLFFKYLSNFTHIEITWELTTDMEKNWMNHGFHKLVFQSLNYNFRIFLYFFFKVKVIPEMTSGYISKIQIISKQVIRICWFFFFKCIPKVVNNSYTTVTVELIGTTVKKRPAGVLNI